MSGVQPCHRRFVVREPRDVSAVRRAVAEMAPAAGGPRQVLAAERLAAELAGDLVLRPGGGFVLARPLMQAGGLELLSVAHGSNGRSPQLSEALGHATPAGPAEPAPAPCWDVWSYSGRGTAVLARVVAEPGPSTGALRAGAVSVAAVDGERCGDGWSVAEAEGFVSVFIVDGLGHGAGAEPAAEAAVCAFLKEPTAHPEVILRRVHNAMLGTRGGVAAVCRIDRAAGQAIFAGVGNITGRLFDGPGSRALVSSRGSVGTQVAFPRPRVEIAPWRAGAALVFASDGVRSEIDLGARPDLLSCHPSLSAAILLRDLHKGNDDATVIVIRDDGPRTP